MAGEWQIIKDLYKGFGNNPRNRELTDTLANIPVPLNPFAINRGVNTLSNVQVSPIRQSLLNEAYGVNDDAVNRAAGQQLMGILSGGFDVAPTLPIAKTGAKSLLNVTKDLPVGLSIKDVSKSQFVPGVKSGEELIVHHNIPEQGLLDVQEFGGKLAVPSIAISKTSQPLTNFGDISLIGSKEMAIPSKNNPVWSFDAYTKRFPRIEMQGTSKGKDLIKNEFLSPYGKFSDETNVKIDVSGLSDNLRSNIDMSSGKIKYLSEIGQLPNPNDFEKYYDFLNSSRDKFRSLEQSNPEFLNDFSLWSKNKINELNSTGEFKDVIYAGTDKLGRQKYIPATMDNFIKQLKGGAGEEGFNYGLGQTRAKVAPKFKSLLDVTSSRNRIVTPEQFQEIKNTLDSEHEYLSDKLTEIIDKKHGGYYSRQTADALLEDMYTGKYNPSDEFNKTYDSLISKEIKEKAKKLGSQLKTMPTEYFEAKPQRAVSLSEFSGAIIPKETSQSARYVLSKHGIDNILEYGTPEERVDLFKKFGGQMFSAGIAAPTGLLMTNKEKKKK